MPPTYLISVASVLLVLVCSNGYGQNQPVELDELITLALANNPQIEIAGQQYNQSEGGVVQAKSGYLPHLGVTGSVGRVHVEELQPTDEDNVVQGGLSGSQLIYDFGRTMGGIESTKLQRQAARSNFEQRVHDVILQVKTSYYTVLEKRALVTVALKAVENYDKHLYRARKYFTAGVRTQIDITNAELELANAKLNLLRANSNLKTTKVKLERIIGVRPNNGDYTVKVNHGPIETMASQIPENNHSLAQLLETAPKNRPGLEQLDQLFLAAEAAVKKVQGDNWPVISANGSYDIYETDLTSLADQWQLTALLSWEIFSGFETEGKLVEARANMLELGASKHELELSITQDVTDSYLRAEENREGVKIADLAVRLALRNLELAEGRYKAGLGDMIEFNDAQLNFTASQSDLISTYFAYLVALANMERAAGLNPGIAEDRVELMLAR